MKRIALVIALLASFPLVAQQLPYLNPLVSPQLYNPAYVGSSGYGEVWLVHRRQWVGINNAPVVNAAQLQLPFNSGLSLGLTAVDNRQGFFATSLGRLTTNYAVQLGEEHELAAGLSIGAGTNRVDVGSWGDAFTADPTALAAMDGQYFLSGGLGLRYRLRGLQLGVALPQLAQSDRLEVSDVEQAGIDLNRYQLLSARYRLNFNQIGVEPQVLYHRGASLPDEYEAGATVYYRQLAWVGGSYRQSSNASAWAGVQLYRQLRLNYAYELAVGSEGSDLGGTHEVLLAFRFGKKKRSKEPIISEAADEAVIDNPLATNEPSEAAEEPVDAEPASQPTTADAPNEPPLTEEDEATPQLADREAPDTPVGDFSEDLAFAPDPLASPDNQVAVAPSNDPLELEPGYYVVVGAFGVQGNAIRYQRALETQGQSSEYGFSSKTQLYYVYVKQSGDVSSARRRYEKVREIPMFMFDGAWVLKVEENQR